MNIKEDLHEWLDMRTAYERYSERAKKPVRFDSFRRWVTQEKVLSRKVGHFKQVSAGAVDGLADSLNEPALDRTIAVIKKHLEGSGIPAFVAVADQDLSGTKEGVIPLGAISYASSEEEFQVLHHAVEVVALMTEIQDGPTAVIQFESGREIHMVSLRTVTVTCDSKHLDRLREMDKEIGVAQTEWVLAWLASKGVVHRRIENGEVFVQADPVFAESWKKARRKTRVKSPRGKRANARTANRC